MNTEVSAVRLLGIAQQSGCPAQQLGHRIPGGHVLYRLLQAVQDHRAGGLDLFLAEAIVLAVSKIGAYGLISLSQEFVEAGAPEPSYFQTLGDFLYHGLDRLGYDIHMLFFCLGGILWYYLPYNSRLVPRPLAIWGLVAVCLLSIPVLLVLYHRASTPLMVLGLPYAPFELVLGVWLIVKG